MSEAVILAIVTPIAAAISALILKIWEAIAKSKQQSAEDARSVQDGYRAERDQALKKVEHAEQMARKWRKYYMELYNQFYLVRLAHAQATQDSSSLNTSALGVAPHERRDELFFFDSDEEL